MAGEEADRERRPLRLRCTACCFRRGFDLKQRQPGMIENKVPPPR